MAMSDEADATRSIQEILDPLCLVSVDINPEMRVKAAQGPADPMLVEQGWRTFLIKVRNEAGATAELRVVSPHAQSLHNAPGRETASDKFFRQGEKRGGKLPREQLWLDLAARMCDHLAPDSKRSPDTHTYILPDSQA